MRLCAALPAHRAATSGISPCLRVACPALPRLGRGAAGARACSFRPVAATNTTSLGAGLESKRALQPTTPARASTPLFLMETAVFPNVYQTVTIREPRNVLMVEDTYRRRAKFGVVMMEEAEPALATAWNGCSTGTLCDITRMKSFSGGVIVLELRGLRRFSITDKSRNSLGSWEGQVKFFMDKRRLSEEEEQDSLEQQQRLQRLLRECLPPHILAKMESQKFFSMPPSDFSFNLAAVLPFTVHQRLRVLESRTPGERLRLEHDALLSVFRPGSESE